MTILLSFTCIVFLRNERDLGVKNGTLGVVEQLDDTRMGVRLDDGRRLAFDQKAYTDLDHGYATTIHKSQGVTVDGAHVLASGYLDRHATYVALSRHRQAVALHYDRETFADEAALGRTLARERAKDSTLDYREVFAERRGLAPSGAEGVFAGFRGASSGTGASRDARRDELARVQAFARAWRDGARMRDAGHDLLAHQRIALDGAAGALDRASPGLAAKVAAVLERDPALAAPAARGRPAALLHAAERDTTGREAERTQGPERDASRDRGLER